MEALLKHFNIEIPEDLKQKVIQKQDKLKRFLTS